MFIVKLAPAANIYRLDTRDITIYIKKGRLMMRFKLFLNVTDVLLFDNSAGVLDKKFRILAEFRARVSSQGNHRAPKWGRGKNTSRRCFPCTIVMPNAARRMEH